MKKLNLDELKNENQGKNLFATPDNYFDTLPSKIQNKIQGRKNQKNSFALFSQIYQSLAFRVVSPVLACGLLLFIGVHFYQENGTKNIENSHENSHAALNDVTPSAIQEYLLLTNVDEDEIIRVCVANGKELYIDGLPAEISEEILEGELDVEDYL
jgi:hypothetical protein